MQKRKSTVTLILHTFTTDLHITPHFSSERDLSCLSVMLSVAFPALLALTSALQPSTPAARQRNSHISMTQSAVQTGAVISRRAAILGTAAGLAVQSSMAPAVASGPSIFEPAAGSLVGTTVLITGANTGLGLESSKRL